jgi:hypothetical protein
MERALCCDSAHAERSDDGNADKMHRSTSRSVFLSLCNSKTMLRSQSGVEKASNFQQQQLRLLHQNTAATKHRFQRSNSPTLILSPRTPRTPSVSAKTHVARNRLLPSCPRISGAPIPGNLSSSCIATWRQRAYAYAPRNLSLNSYSLFIPGTASPQPASRRLWLVGSPTWYVRRCSSEEAELHADHSASSLCVMTRQIRVVGIGRVTLSHACS